MNFNSVNLKKIEALIKEGGYTLRYEKGNFNSGYCVLMDKNVVIVNKYFTDDVKFNKLVDIILQLNFNNLSELSESSIKILEKIKPESLISNPIPFDDGTK